MIYLKNKQRHNVFFDLAGGVTEFQAQFGKTSGMFSRDGIYLIDTMIYREPTTHDLDELQEARTEDDLIDFLRLHAHAMDSITRRRLDRLCAPV